MFTSDYFVPTFRRAALTTLASTYVTSVMTNPDYNLDALINVDDLPRFLDAHHRAADFANTAPELLERLPLNEFDNELDSLRPVLLRLHENLYLVDGVQNGIARHLHAAASAGDRLPTEDVLLSIEAILHVRREALTARLETLNEAYMFASMWKAVAAEAQAAALPRA